MTLPVLPANSFPLPLYCPPSFHQILPAGMIGKGAVLMWLVWGAVPVVVSFYPPVHSSSMLRYREVFSATPMSSKPSQLRPPSRTHTYQPVRRQRPGLRREAGLDGTQQPIPSSNNLARTLQSLFFPVSVLVAGLVGATFPKCFNALSDRFVTRALALVMGLMGCTLTLQDFARVGSSKKAILLGW